MAETPRAEARGSQISAVAERVALSRKCCRLIQVKLIMVRLILLAGDPLTA